MARLKTCKACKSKFEPSRPMQVVCTPSCAITYAAARTDKEKKQKEAADRKERRERLRSMDGINKLAARAQSAFNAWIRARDDGKPCISCGRPIPPQKYGGSADAGHYRSVGAAKHLRFDESNCHLQCKQCNRDKSGNHVAYRAGLIARIGLAEVERIESDNTVRKWTRDELIEIAARYRKLLREHKNN